MVLWELTLATAYVLGLKKTYRLALRAQRRILGRKFPRIREFTERRTRTVFTVALNMYKEIQRRDITYGRNVGNWLLRMLDRARPQANIRGASGTERSLPPRLESANKLENQVKRTTGGSQVESTVRAKTSAETGKPVDMTQVGQYFGSSLRSRFVNGLRLKPKPTTTSLPLKLSKSNQIPVSAFGLWWQPVRRSMGDFTLKPQFAGPYGLPVNAPVTHVLQSGSLHQPSVYRQDIAQWMGLPWQTSAKSLT